ncbi:MAG TPA: hypothetical protein VJ814_06225 [Gaiellaceae bacterium]|nr:hypothetical protein [Gaiellaceae bacterium]
MAQYVDLTARRDSTRTRATAQAPAYWATASFVGAAGAIHLYLWFDYFHRVHVVGDLFLVNAAGGIALGAAMLVRRDALLLLAALGFAVGTLAGFVASTQWGLFGYHETFWGSWQEAAGGVELAAALLAALLLARRLR